MSSSLHSLRIAVAIALCSVSEVEAQVVTYTDEATYLAALAALSAPVVHEGFEDNLAWGGVRSSISGGQMTAAVIHSQGLTWIGNNPGSEITTGQGAARTGGYGYYQLPHGNPTTGVTDGFVASAATPLIAIGGWIRTNTPYAGMSLFLDGTEAPFNGSTALGPGGHVFFGAIAPAGFQHFEFKETEAAPGDWKLVFADDFLFAFGGTLVDCNQNGIGDALDIANGTSVDCNLDLVPDECQIDVNSSAPGGPFFCQSGCSSDCNANGLLDDCEVIDPTVFTSGPLGPIGDGSPQSFLIPAHGAPVADVLVDFHAYANLGGNDEYLDVMLNGVPVGRAYEYDGEDCPETALAETRLVIPEQTYRNLVGAGPAFFELVASSEVDPDDCDQPSHVEVAVTIFRPSALDGNANGILDECESIGTSYCTAAANAAHPGGAHISATGSEVVSGNDVTLSATQLTPMAFGFFIVSDTPGYSPNPGGSYGNLCLAGTIGRYQMAVLNSGAGGTFMLSLDLNAIPQPTGTTPALPGVSLYFQAWYRDVQGSTPGSNFTDAVGIDFQ